MAVGQAWHGITPGSQSLSPRATWTPEERLADMDVLGVDVHVVSTGAGFSYDDMEAQTVAAIHWEFDDEVHQRTLDSLDPFKGFARSLCRTSGPPSMSWHARCPSETWWVR
jgi:hypothetical protein